MSAITQPRPVSFERRSPRLALIEGEARGTHDRVACGGCGDSFPAPEGGALLYALKGSCPRCGGEFELQLGS